MNLFEQIVLFRELRWKLQLSFFFALGINAEKLSVNELEKMIKHFFFSEKRKNRRSFCKNVSLQQYQNDVSSTELVVLSSISKKEKHIAISQLIDEIRKEEMSLCEHMTIFQIWELYMRHIRRLAKNKTDVKTYSFFRKCLISELKHLKIERHVAINLTFCFP